VQRELAVAASHKAEGDTQAAKDVITLTKKRDTLADEIGLHDKYDSRLGSLEGRRGGGAGDLTANQRTGAFAVYGQTTLIDVNRQQLTVLKEMLRVSNTPKSHLVQPTYDYFHGAINGPFQ
jgi:hypothetical protein